MNTEPPKIERLRSPGPRNLATGLAALAVSIVLVAASVALAGPALSLVALFASLLVSGVLWVVWSLGIPRQPHGLLAVLGITVATAMLIPLMAGVMRVAAPARGTPEPVIAPLVQTTPPPDRERLPLLSASFPVDTPNIDTEPWIEVVQSSKIKIKGQLYRLNKGERFGFRRVDGNEVVFRTRNFLVSLPTSAVEVHYPESKETVAVESPAEPAPTDAEPSNAEAGSPLEITRAAQATAMERYPALSIKDSKENAAYVASYLQLKQSNPDFFKDPEWPLLLAEACAERDGWKREDLDQ